MITTLIHPGQAPAQRWASVPCTPHPVDLILPMADTLAQSVALALADFDGGWLVLEDVPMANLDFVVPGIDPSGAHAAWYAGPHRMGAGRIHHLGLHAGRKDGGPWLHGHGSFQSDGWQGPSFGHILPFESRLAQPTRAIGWAITGARFEVQSDPETHFPLHQPVARGTGAGAALITLRPNQDLSTALVSAAAEVGIAQGTVLGLGSIVHPQLQDTQPLDSFATEILLTNGFLDGVQTRIEAEIVTLDGAYHKGWLQAGHNGICITAELLVIDHASLCRKYPGG